MSNKAERRTRKMMRASVSADAQAKVLSVVGKARRALRRSLAKTIIIMALIPANVWLAWEILRSIASVR